MIKKGLSKYPTWINIFAVSFVYLFDAKQGEVTSFIGYARIIGMLAILLIIVYFIARFISQKKQPNKR